MPSDDDGKIHVLTSVLASEQGSTHPELVIIVTTTIITRKSLAEMAGDLRRS